MNKPQFTVVKNIGYALQGMRDVLVSETSFRIQLGVISILSIILFILDIGYWERAVLILSMLPVLIVEALNSAIERVVDLVTREHHELARQAKDIGAFAVLLAFLFALFTWLFVIASHILDMN